MHDLAVKSAYDVMPHATIFMYYKHEPSGEVKPEKRDTQAHTCTVHLHTLTYMSVANQASSLKTVGENTPIHVT